MDYGHYGRQIRPSPNNEKHMGWHCNIFTCINIYITPTPFFVKSTRHFIHHNIYLSYITLHGAWDSNFSALSSFQTCGFVEVVCGFLLLCDTQRILLSRLLAAPDGGLAQPPFYYLALALLGGGMIMCAAAALGCWATYMPGYIILSFVSVVDVHYLFKNR